MKKGYPKGMYGNNTNKPKDVYQKKKRKVIGKNTGRRISTGGPVPGNLKY